MPYERCIETWAREEGIGLIPGPGRRGAGQVRKKPGKSGRIAGSSILIDKWLPEMQFVSILVHDFSQETCQYSERTGGPFSELVMLQESY